MSIGIQIRPTLKTDLSGLMAIKHSIISDYVWQLDLRKDNGEVQVGFREVRLPRPVEVQYPRPPQLLMDSWSHRTAAFTARRGGEPIGYVLIHEHSPATTAWITDLVVHQDHRRKGIGSALLNAAQDWALSRGDRDVFLEMASKNSPAMRLALKYGFEFCGYNDHYYVTKDVALFFGRTLV